MLIKLVPIALLPLLLIWHAHRRGWASAIRDAAISIGVVIVGVLPFAIIAPSGTWYFVGYNLRRPPQLESLTSNLFLLLAKFGHYRFRIVEDYHSNGLHGAGPAAVATVTPFRPPPSARALVVVAAAVGQLRTRGSRHHRHRCAATIVALTVFGKVLSPQYMMWLLPVTLILQGRRGRIAVALTVAALVLTLTYFPTHFAEISKVHIYVLRILTLRNVMLIALLVVCWPRASSARKVLAADPTIADHDASRLPECR